MEKKMKFQLVLNIEVESEETKSMIEGRLLNFNYNELSNSLSEPLDEFGEVTSVELEEIY